MVRDARPCGAPHHEGLAGLILRRRESAVSKDVPRDKMHHTPPRSRGADSARVLHEVVPRKTEGAGKAGCPEHPQPVCIGSKHTVVTTSTPEITRLSPRNGFNGFLRALVSAKSARMCERAVLSKPPVVALAKALKRRSSARRLLAHRSKDLPRDPICAPTLPRPPHPIPRP